MPVTAQDFLEAIVQDKSDSPMIFVGETLEAFDALLSRARQDAVEEYKQSLTHGS